jgi:PKD repeat protein
LRLSSIGFPSAVADTFTILTATSISGTFAAGAGAIFTAPNGTRYQLSYTSTSVFLTHINTAPTLTAPSDQSSTEGSSTPFSLGSFADPDPDSPWTVDVNWGDDSSPTTFTMTSPGTITAPSHPYADEGSFNVTVTVTDRNGASDSKTFSVTVADADVLSADPMQPTLSAQAEGTAFTGLSLATFDDSYTGAPAGDFTARIDWGDGSPLDTTTGVVSGSTGGPFTVRGNHRYTEEGSYTITVTLAEDGSGTASFTITRSNALLVNDQQLTNLATAAMPTGKLEGSAIGALTGIASFSDPGGAEPVSDYTATINWGDGTSAAGTVVSTGGNHFRVDAPDHTYAEEGTYTVNVTLRHDALSAVTTPSHSITIADPPVVATGLAASAVEGSAFTGALASFTDPGGAESGSGHYTVASIDWGDGSLLDTTSGAISGPADGVFTTSGTHTYAEEGSYTVTVILDHEGIRTMQTTTATVVDAILTALGTTIHLDQGTSFTGTVATFTDANPAGTVSDFSATITWEDGSSSTGTISQNSDGSFTVTGSHLFAQAGNGQTITVGINDVGGASTSAQSTANVAESQTDVTPPVITIRSPTSPLDANYNLTISGQVTDPDSPVANLQVVIDGGTSQSVSFDDSGSFGVTTSFPLNHTADGIHTLQFQATDPAGNLATASYTFTLDTTPPVIGSFDLSPTDATGPQTAAASIVTLVGQTDPNITVELLETGAVALTNNQGRFQFPGVALVPGDNTFTLQALDQAHNVTTQQQTFHRFGSTGQPNAVLVWNQTLLQAIQLDATPPPQASRAMAMVQIAVYNAVSAIAGTPGYYFRLSAPSGASPEAAVSQAAHDVLSYLYPAQQAAFDSLLATELSGVPDGQGKSDGIQLGQQSASAIIALRANDGWNKFVDYTPGSGPGVWQPTPPMYMEALDPQWATLTPFAMTSDSQFRPAGPPALSSQAWADAFNEVKSLGAADSTTRTGDQTQIARFWADGAGSYTPAGHWNEIAQQIAQQNGDSLSADARLFAELDIALADAGIVAWDAKYTYNAWRPITAIRNADQAGNPAVTADPNWTPLLVTPNFPEYVSGHSTYSAAAAAILDAFFGTNVNFSTTSVTWPGVTRSFSSFDQAAAEAGESRIYAGIHFQFSNQDGQAAGRALGNYVLSSFAVSQDTLPPQISLDDVLPSGATNHNVNVTGHVVDNLSGVASLTAQLDGGSIFTLTFDESGNFTIPTSLALDGSADGQHTYTLVSTDFAGNTSVPVTFTFSLATQLPAVTVTSPVEASDLMAGTTLTGTMTGHGAAITAVSYAFDGGTAMPIVFDTTTGTFSQALDLSKLSLGAHTLTVSASDAAGNTASSTAEVNLPAAIPLTISSLTPANGANDVGVTFRPKVVFSRPVDLSTLNSNNFYASDSTGARLPATIVPAADGSYAWLFFTTPMPGASTITLAVDGSTILAPDGTLLDAAGNGTPGSSLTSTFVTVNLAGQPDTPVYSSPDQTNPTLLRGASITGIIADPGSDLEPMTFDDVRVGPDGVLETSDDVYVLPLPGVRVYIIGHEDQAVYTDATGRFTLSNVPTGDVKLVLDGTTVTNAGGTRLIDVPSGFYFPEMVLDLTDVQPGLVNTVMGSMGTPQQQAARATVQGVYLPRLQTSILKPVSDTEVTHITADAISAPNLTLEERQYLTLDIQPGSLIGFNGNPLIGARVGISTVPPSLVNDMLPPGLLQHSFDITIQAPGVAVFSKPVTLTFPNIMGDAPGTRVAFLSFDHTTGRLVFEGTILYAAKSGTSSKV